MRFLILLSMLTGGVLAHPNHEKRKVERPEKTYSVELPDRVVTVERLKGPPPKDAVRGKKQRGAKVPKPELPVESFFVHSFVCEDQRTYLEWWSLHASPKVIYRAWSDLDWNRFTPLSSFENGQRNYSVMHFATASSKKELAELGKPQDPADSKGQGVRKKKELFSLVEFVGTDSKCLYFMRACHRRFQNGGSTVLRVEKEKKGKEALRTAPKEKKRSSLKYWRSK